MKADVIMYNNAIAACQCASTPARALSLLSRMKDPAAFTQLVWLPLSYRCRHGEVMQHVVYFAHWHIEARVMARTCTDKQQQPLTEYASRTEMCLMLSVMCS